MNIVNMNDELLVGNLSTLPKQELMDFLFMLEDLLQDLLAQTKTINESFQADQRR